MKVRLLNAASDFDPRTPLPQNAEDLEQDLGLAALFNAMAGPDAFIRDIVRKVVLGSLSDAGAIRYRQAVLRDVEAHRDLVRDLYDLTLEAERGERSIHSMYFFARSPALVLARALQLLAFYRGLLARLRELARCETVESEAMRRLLAELRAELAPAFFAELDDHLKELRFSAGVTLSAGLGDGLKGTGYVLHRASGRRRSWAERLLHREPPYVFEVPDRDEAGLQALEDLRGEGLRSAATAVGLSAEHVKSFFAQLRRELAFYLGALRLRDVLAERGLPCCMPDVQDASSGCLTARDLRDPGLALQIGGVVGNDLQADGRPLIVVTGANRGGKSTFLRSVGVAALMTQCGLYVVAQAFSMSVSASIVSHFRREEDKEMLSGKLDEELGRLERSLPLLGPGSLLLLNESFASTNEREGSEIARQVVQALGEAGVRIVFVTHLYDFAESCCREAGGALCLRAALAEDGRRTFRVTPGAPEPSSHGEDLLRTILGPS